MYIDLFNQGLLLLVCFLSFLAIVYGFLQNPFIHSLSKQHKKHPYGIWKHVAIIVGASLLLGLLIHSIVQIQFTQDDIPWELVIWSMPCGVSIVLLIYNIRNLWGAIVSAGGIVCSLILLLLLANNYYHYYPTVGSLFRHDKPDSQVSQALTTNSSATHTVFEQYYQPLAHQSTKGELRVLDIPASASFSPRKGRIYIPPALHGNDMIKLPVIVLLAGYPGDPVHWEQAGLLGMMDDFASKHKGLAPIVAVVDFAGEKDVDTECVDSKLGMSETYLVKDVPAYLKAHFQVSVASADWTIAGYSAGGTCSTLLALRNPSVYQNYMNISGDTTPSLKTPADTLATLFGGSKKAQDEHMPNSLLQRGNDRYKTMNAWYFIGQQDNMAMLRRIADQAKLAETVGITVEHTVVTGHHGFLVWKQGYIEGLPWLMNRIRLTSEG